MADKPAIVVDQGSFQTKFGYNNQEEPFIERTCVGKELITTKKAEKKDENKEDNNISNIPKTRKIINFGNDAIQNMKTCKLKYFIKNNEIVSFTALESFYKECILPKLNININEIDNTTKLNSILLTQSYKNYYKKNKKLSKLSEFLFETLNINGLLMREPSILGLYGSGNIDGLVIDSGYEHTTIMPIINGYRIGGYNDESIKYIKLGAKHVDLYFQALLRKSGINYHTNTEIENLINIKEKLCELMIDGGYIKKESDDDELQCIRYTLPDNKILQVGSARYRAGELFFAPYLLGLNANGLHKEIISSINNLSTNLKQILYQNVVLCGGNTHFKNFPRRLMKEITNYDYNMYDYNLVVKAYRNEYNKQLTLNGDEYGDDNDGEMKNEEKKMDESKMAMSFLNNFIKKKCNKRTNLKVKAAKNRVNLPFIGGKVLTTLEQFDGFITSEKYKEFGGEAILYRYT